MKAPHWAGEKVARRDNTRADLSAACSVAATVLSLVDRTADKWAESTDASKAAS
jgi:hypothetical protein